VTKRPTRAVQAFRTGPRRHKSDTFRCIFNENVPESGAVAVLQTLGYSPCLSDIPDKTDNNVSQPVKVISGNGNHLRIYPFEDELKSMPEIPRFHFRISETSKTRKGGFHWWKPPAHITTERLKGPGLASPGPCPPRSGSVLRGREGRVPSLAVRGCPGVYPCGSTRRRVDGVRGSRRSTDVGVREHGRPSPDREGGHGD